MKTLKLVEGEIPIYTKKNIMDRLVANAKHDRELIMTPRQMRSFVKNGMSSYEHDKRYSEIFKSMQVDFLYSCLTYCSLTLWRTRRRTLS